MFSVSEKAFARAEKMKDRGYYFDFLEFKKQQAEDMTPSTPSISHIYALQSKLDDIFAEGVDDPLRAARKHERAGARLGARTRLRVLRRREGYRSKTLTCVRNNRGIDVAKLVRRSTRATSRSSSTAATARSKGKTFRLSNMGDETEETVAHLLRCLDDCLGIARQGKQLLPGGRKSGRKVQRPSPLLGNVRRAEQTRDRQSVLRTFGSSGRSENHPNAEKDQAGAEQRPRRISLRRQAPSQVTTRAGRGDERDRLQFRHRHKRHQPVKKEKGKVMIRSSPGKAGRKSPPGPMKPRRIAIDEKPSTSSGTVPKIICQAAIIEGAS